MKVKGVGGAEEEEGSAENERRKGMGMIERNKPKQSANNAREQ